MESMPIVVVTGCEHDDEEGEDDEGKEEEEEEEDRNNHHFPLLAGLSSTVDCALLCKWHRCLQASFGQYYIAHFNLVEPNFWWHLYASLAVPFHDVDREADRTKRDIRALFEHVNVGFQGFITFRSVSKPSGSRNETIGQTKKQLPIKLLGNLNKREAYSFFLLSLELLLLLFLLLPLLPLLLLLVLCLCFCCFAVFAFAAFVHLVLVCCFVHLSLSCEVLAAFAACVVFFPFSLLCFFRRSLVFLFLLCCSGWISSINDGLTVCPCNLTMLGAAVPLHVLEILYPCLRPLCPCAPKSFELRTPTNFMNTGHQEFYEPVGPKVL